MAAAENIFGERLIQTPDAQLGQCSLAGTRYGDLNQDFTALRQLLPAGDAPGVGLGWVAAVLDGHGMLGERAAEAAAAAVLDALDSRLPGAAAGDEAAVQRAATKAFKTGHEAALQLYREPPEQYTYPRGSSQEMDYSLTYVDGLPMYKPAGGASERLLEFGTTCTVAAVLQGGRLLLANAGDSGAVLGSRLEDGSFSGEELTVRHWGLNEDEAGRIRSSVRGRVEILEADGYISVAAGRFRGYQLSMTRALGHNMLADFGVIATPSLASRQLTLDDACLIVASDGVWDVFGPSEAVECVMHVVEEGGDAAAAAQQLCEEAIERAIDGEDGEADNTSAVVAVFGPSCS